MKLATLLAISTWIRSSELAFIDRTSITITEEGVSFSFLIPRRSQTKSPMRFFYLKNLKIPRHVRWNVFVLFSVESHSYVWSLFDSPWKYLVEFRGGEQSSFGKYHWSLDQIVSELCWYKYKKFFCTFSEKCSSFKCGKTRNVHRCYT